MRFLFYIFPLLLLSPTIDAQNSFKGKVVNELNGQPLGGASIYYNNTSIGTTSNNAGEFILPQPGIANADLVISSVGFQTLVYKVNGDEFSGRPYVFQLKAKEATLENVLVLTDLTRKKYLQLFIENFLGITEEAASSHIVNTDAIVFTSSPNEPGVLMAFTDTPLVIVNKMLGYKIHFQLEMFSYDKQSSSTSFYGFTRYEEMGSKPRWIKNRLRAYHGSTLHFYRALIADRLDAERFKVFVVKEIQMKTDTGVRKMETAYPVTAKFLLEFDSASDGYRAAWDNKLMVQYMKNPASKPFLSNATLLEGNIPTGFRSWLTIKKPTIQIDKSGILQDPLSVIYSGYWIYEKAANLLPFNYQP